MKETRLVCISCPLGCNLTVVENDGKITVSGNSCPKGKIYGENETVNPVRTVTAVARVEGGEIAMVSVKTNVPVPKGRIFDVLREIEKLNLRAPVQIGTALIKNVCNLNADIVATKTVQRRGEA